MKNGITHQTIKYLLGASVGEGVALTDLALPDLDVNGKATVEPTRKAASDTRWIFMIYLELCEL
jgi:hypothetical protein